MSGYGWILHRRRYGPEHDRVLQSLLDSQQWDRARTEENEWRNVLETVAYAYQHVPYYYRRTWKDLGFHPEDPLRDWNDFRQLPITGEGHGESGLLGLRRRSASSLEGASPRNDERNDGQAAADDQGPGGPSGRLGFPGTATSAVGAAHVVLARHHP
ncbi:MAG: hypothetical protein R3E12_18210 [Candidatus Eisenbacteria bacterium]